MLLLPLTHAETARPLERGSAPTTAATTACSEVFFKLSFPCAFWDYLSLLLNVESIVFIGLCFLLLFNPKRDDKFPGF